MLLVDLIVAMGRNGGFIWYYTLQMLHAGFEDTAWRVSQKTGKGIVVTSGYWIVSLDFVLRLCT
ncbi:MAG: hypothetical protein HFJ01_03290 [Lachnospiraceae bacterium]|jgi:hypothetical protein|nr:hypothetical protein [Lachnospiraceae bacterium]